MIRDLTDKWSVKRAASTDALAEAGALLLAPPKQANLKLPEWEYNMEVRNYCFAKGVRLDIEGIEAEPSDNYFDLLPEVEKRVIARTESDIAADELRRCLRVRSVAEAQSE